MKTKKMLSLLATITALATQQGCDPYTIRHSGRPDKITANSPLTLLGKNSIPYHERAILYFDVDGNTNTTEVVAQLFDCDALSSAKVFDLKIGDKKTLAQWQKTLVARKETRLVWTDVREHQ